jgi:predicted exporter
MLPQDGKADRQTIRSRILSRLSQVTGEELSRDPLSTLARHAHAALSVAPDKVSGNIPH